MLVNTPTPISYPEAVAFVKTKKRVNSSSLEWDLWLERKQVPAIIKRLQAEHIIGPAYIDKDDGAPGGQIYYDVIANNDKVHTAPWWQLWEYKLETGILFTRFLWLAIKNRIAGKKHPLDIVADTTYTVARELKVDYRIGVDQQRDSREYQTIELREPVDDMLSEEMLTRLREELTPKGFEINRSKNLLEFFPSA